MDEEKLTRVRSSKSLKKVFRDEKIANYTSGFKKRVLAFQYREEKKECRFNREKNEKKNKIVVEVDETLQNISLACFEEAERVIFTIPEEIEIIGSLKEQEDHIEVALSARKKKKEKIRINFMKIKIHNLQFNVDMWKANLQAREDANERLKKINVAMKEKVAQLEVDIGLKDKFFDELLSDILRDIDILQNGFEETKMELYKRHLELRMFLHNEYSKYEIKKDKATNALFTCFGWWRRDTLFERIVRLQRQQNVIKDLMKQSRMQVEIIQKTQLSWQ